jgi:hypothetical protein
MKLLIVLSVFASYTGGYEHAVADAEGKTYRLLTLTKYNVRDTLVKDSTGFIYKK